MWRWQQHPVTNHSFIWPFLSSPLLLIAAFRSKRCCVNQTVSSDLSGAVLRYSCSLTDADPAHQLLELLPRRNAKTFRASQHSEWTRDRGRSIVGETEWRWGGGGVALSRVRRRDNVSCQIKSTQWGDRSCADTQRWAEQLGCDWVPPPSVWITLLHPCLCITVPGRSDGLVSFCHKTTYTQHTYPSIHQKTNKQTNCKQQRTLTKLK